ncbi:hypothetical protein SAMN05421788_101394 [Filimonas lacunae]|uniref:Uncharacterized protein n=1 Tax=Filimonas lacunae TaxID=477680 RepID=A0A173MN79_9BACT|nr:hypothetical protein [Filimonas lacunae]BAV08946.1 hypothetical protein FLA_4993 [Filimonas lacunae]SIS64490.1 hypothetical protein SAMN05421788_101394 [Filimonas lacunae]
MKKKYGYFIPRTDGELLRWLNNFKEQINIAGPTLGLTPIQVTELADKAQKGIDALLSVVIKKQDYMDAVLFKNMVRDEEVGFIANAAVVLKRNPLFTDNIGGALGIINTTSLQDRVTLKPTLKVNVFPQYVEVGFNKQGQTGVSVFSRIHGTDEWIKIGDAERSPYKDTRPLQVPGKAEIREYMALCYSNDESVGQNSEVSIAVFGG